MQESHCDKRGYNYVSENSNVTKCWYIMCSMNTSGILVSVKCRSLIKWQVDNIKQDVAGEIVFSVVSDCHVQMHYSSCCFNIIWAYAERQNSDTQCRSIEQCYSSFRFQYMRNIFAGQSISNTHSLTVLSFGILICQIQGQGKWAHSFLLGDCA